MTAEEDLRLHPPVSEHTGGAGKREFHQAAARWLRALAKAAGLAAGLAAGTYTVRSDKAGPGIAGDVTLHGERIYVQIGDMAADPSIGILWRTCQGRGDFTGGRNRWWPWRAVDRVDEFAAEIRRATAEAA